MNKGDVIQFNENHKWCGTLGIIQEVKQCYEGIRYMVGVPMPQHSKGPHIYLLWIMKMSLSILDKLF